MRFCWNCCCRVDVGLNKVGFVVMLFCFTLVMFVTSTILTHQNYNRSQQKEWAWVGGVQSTSASFRVRGPAGSNRWFVVSTSSDLRDVSLRVLLQPLSFDESGSDYGVKSVDIASLESNTKYYFGTLNEGNDIVWNVGSFRTPSPEGSPMDFRIAMGGCAQTGSKSNVFDAIIQHDPLLFIHMGDLHYEDLNTMDIARRVGAYDRVMGSPSQGRLFSSVAMSYMWDDHDWLGNNQDGSHKEEGEAAKKSYQVVFPHYPLAAAAALENSNSTGPLNVAPYQAFTIGTVRFVITDLRSESLDATDLSVGSVYSENQKEWLFRELENADSYDFIVWVTTRPWTGPAQQGTDQWASFDADRRELSEKIASTVGQKSQNLLVLSSDNHMVAYDDGSSTDFSGQTANPAGFPILHSGPMANFGSGFTDFFSPLTNYFTDGCHTINSQLNHQYSTLDFSTMSGSEPCVEITSYSHDNDEVILTRTLCGKVMRAGSEKVHTCKAKKLSITTNAFLSTGYAFCFVFIVISCCYMRRNNCCWEAMKWSAIHIVFVPITMAAAAAGAFALGSVAVDTFVVALVIFLQCFFALIFLCCFIKKNKGKDEHEDDSFPEMQPAGSESELKPSVY